MGKFPPQDWVWGTLFPFGVNKNFINFFPRGRLNFEGLRFNYKFLPKNKILPPSGKKTPTHSTPGLGNLIGEIILPIIFGEPFLKPQKFSHLKLEVFPFPVLSEPSSKPFFPNLKPPQNYWGSQFNPNLGGFGNQPQKFPNLKSQITLLVNIKRLGVFLMGIFLIKVSPSFSTLPIQI